MAILSLFILLHVLHCTTILNYKLRDLISGCDFRLPNFRARPWYSCPPISKILATPLCIYTHVFTPTHPSFSLPFPNSPLSPPLQEPPTADQIQRAVRNSPRPMSVALGTGSPQQPLATPTSPPTAERTYTEEELGELPVSGCILYTVYYCTFYVHACTLCAWQRWVYTNVHVQGREYKCTCTCTCEYVIHTSTFV